MQIPYWLWVAVVGGFSLVLLVDLVVVDRRPHSFTAKEATRWVLFYIVAALLFGGWLWMHFGAQYGQEFLSGWLTEYSLSVDNLFVFMVIMSSFGVPEAYRHRVLLVGVVIALLLRAILIIIGAAAIQRFAATFFLFAAFLLWTAWTVWRAEDDEPDPEGNALVRLVGRMVPTSNEYEGTRLTAVIHGQRHVTPMLLVMLAIGTTDLLFALDSIPAVFGLTREPFIVLTANAFALMGLRQLYFMLGGLLSRLVFLNKGLAVVLGFIGFKLLLEALHEALHLNVYTFEILPSLAVIVSVLALTTVLSLWVANRHPELIGETEFAQAQQDAAATAGEALEHFEEHDG